MPEVKHSQVWDYRQGCYVAVTDVLDTEHGASRLAGYVHDARAIEAARIARGLMNKRKLEIVK